MSLVGIETVGHDRVVERIVVMQAKKRQPVTQDDRAELLGLSGNVRQRGPVQASDHERLQDELVSELTSMARLLKESGRRVGSTLEADNQILDRQIGQLDRNRDAMSRESQRLNHSTEKTRKGNWSACSSFVLIFLVFLGMVIFIRLIPKNHL